MEKQVYYRLNQSWRFGFQTTEAGASAERGFVADFGTMGVNYIMGNGAVGLGDMIDNAVGTYKMYDGLY